MAKEKKIKLIYNPQAGKKRFFAIQIKQILELLEKYELVVDSFPTKKPGDALEMAKAAVKEGYEMVVVVGGDGTANEAANGLVDSNVPLGIIPMGTFMNIARMLSIPTDVEKAIQLLKIKRVRKIDLGVVSKMSGEKLDTPYYFIETSGVGTEAHVQLEFKKWEKGSLKAFFAIFQHIFSIVKHDLEIVADGKSYNFRANFATVANGPIGGASLTLAPDAKLNDHHLSVVIYKHDPHKLLKHFLRMMLLKKTYKRELITLKAKEVIIKSQPQMLVHADADVFGETPVHYHIKPACLQVICGFTDPDEPPMFVEKDN